MFFDPSEKKWLGKLDDREAFVQWFQEALEKDESELIATALRTLEPRFGQTVAYAFLAAEQRRPMDKNDSDEVKQQLPLTKLLVLLAADYTPALIRILDETGVCLRDYKYLDRAFDLFERMGASYERNGDLIGLARSWMWRGRSHSDKREHEHDLPCYWKALSIFQHVYTQKDVSETKRREAAHGLSSIQHQLAVKCHGSQKDALLYNYRALTLREKLNDDQLRSGSHHNIAQRYQQRKDFGKALFHFLQAVRLDISGSNDHERRITYSNLGGFAAMLHEKELALLFYRKAATFGTRTAEATREIAELLLALERPEEALREVEETLADPNLRPRQRLELCVLALQSSLKIGQAEKEDRYNDLLVDCFLEADVLSGVQLDSVKKKMRDRLATLGEGQHRCRAILLCALGEEQQALAELKTGLTVATPGSEEATRLTDLAGKLDPQERAPSRTPRRDTTEQPGKTCRACNSEYPAPESADQSVAELCPVCAEALKLEEMVRIPAGKVVVQGLLTADLPAFYIDRFPITNRIFRLYHQANKLNYTPECWEHTLWQHPDQPMTCVTPADCRAFCEWRSRLTGRTYRLPTQEEWLRAALGDDGRTYPWGNELPDYTRAAYSVVEDRDSAPPPVGLFPAGASPFGVMDLMGTVWELTASFDTNGKIIYLGGSCDCEAECLLPNQELYRALIVQNLDDRTDKQMGFRCVTEVAGHE